MPSSAPCSPEIVLSPSTPEVSKTNNSTSEEKNFAKELESSNNDDNDNLKVGLSQGPQNLQLVSPTRLLQSPSSISSSDPSLSLSSTHPLKQIANITESLQGKQPSHMPFPFPMPPGSFPIKPYKSILQPLNQTQIDRYETLNTDELVRQVIFFQ